MHCVAVPPLFCRHHLCVPLCSALQPQGVVLHCSLLCATPAAHAATVGLLVVLVFVDRVLMVGLMV
jgi:hypothetical protein